MAGFEFKREGSDRAWIKTPIEVPQNVWANFMFEIFPDFYRTMQSGSPVNEKIYVDGVYLRVPKKYLNRWNSNDVDEIADGQVGDYYRHAYLPHCDRKDRRIHEWGLVHVPETRAFYLEQIIGDLQDNPHSRTALLQRINQTYQNTLLQLFQRLATETLHPPITTESPKAQPKTAKELRDKLSVRLKKDLLLTGNFSRYGENWAGKSESYEIGNLPSFMSGPDNELNAQTSLDFLRDLDSIFGADRTLNGNETVGGFLEYRMHQLYDHLLPAEHRWIKHRWTIERV